MAARTFSYGLIFILKIQRRRDVMGYIIAFSLGLVLTVSFAFTVRRTM